MDRASRPTGLAKIGIALALAGLLAQANAQPIPGALPESAKALSQGEWPAYAGTYAAARYSPLTPDRPQQRQEPAHRLALEVAGHGGQGGDRRRSECDE